MIIGCIDGVIWSRSVTLIDRFAGNVGGAVGKPGPVQSGDDRAVPHRDAAHDERQVAQEEGAPFPALPVQGQSQGHKVPRRQARRRRQVTALTGNTKL